MDLRSQAQMIGGPALADGPTVKVWNEHAKWIDVVFHEDYLDKMDSSFGRMDWAALAISHGAYAVEKPWKFATEIAEMLLAGELSDILSEYRCRACVVDLSGAAEARDHRCG